jgi:hypothetical protein
MQSQRYETMLFTGTVAMPQQADPTANFGRNIPHDQRFSSALFIQAQLVQEC